MDTRWARQQLHGEAVRAGIKAMGLDILTQPGYELPVLTAVSLHEGIDEIAIRHALLEEYSIEVGGGFGALKGRLIRIGLMGYNSSLKNVDTILAALEHVLPRSGFQPAAGAALSAADALYKTKSKTIRTITSLCTRSSVGATLLIVRGPTPPVGATSWSPAGDGIGAAGGIGALSNFALDCQIHVDSKLYPFTIQDRKPEKCPLSNLKQFVQSSSMQDLHCYTRIHLPPKSVKGSANNSDYISTSASSNSA